MNDRQVVAMIFEIFNNEEVDIKLEEYVDKLNSYDWEKHGFKVGGRYVFSQKALSSILL